MNRFIPFALLAFILLGPTAAFSQIPGVISYQGVLTGITGTVDLTFRLYASETGGTVLWSENHGAVELKKEGTFSIDLGSIQPLDVIPFERPYWLEVAVNGTILSPRTKLTASPFAFRSQIANGVANGSIQPDDIKVSGNPPQNNQALTFNGATGEFKWATVGGGSGGGAINELVEGNGIQIDGLTGPSSTISVATGGVTTAMLANGAVTGAKIASETIVGDNIADGSITQDKFAANVGLPSVGTAGGALSGNYPNPTIANDAVATANIAAGAVTTVKLADDAVTSDKIANNAVNSEHVNSLANFAITSLKASDSVGAAKLTVNGVSTFKGGVGIGSAPVTGKSLTVTGTGTTTTTAALDVRDNTGVTLLFVRDDGNVGIGTNSPTAGLEIRQSGAPGLAVTAGSTSFSFGSVPAGGTITIPANTTIVQISSDGAAGSPNTLVMPAAPTTGEFMVIINNDNDPTAGPATIAAGQAGIFVFLPPPASVWRRIN